MKINLKKVLLGRLMIFVCLSLILNVAISTSVVGQVKIKSISEVESQVKSSATSLKTMATYIIGAVLFISLISVIYMVATSNPKSKEWVIGWIVAVIVYIIAISII